MIDRDTAIRRQTLAAVALLRLWDGLSAYQRPNLPPTPEVINWWPTIPATVASPREGRPTAHS